MAATSAPKNVKNHHDLERLSEPTVFPGKVTDWLAMRLWRGVSGLQRLADLAGAAHVQVMLGPTAGNFVGDMESLRLLAATFSEFLDGSLQRNLQQSRATAVNAVNDFSSSFLPESLGLYMAQCPIASRNSPASGDNSDSVEMSPGPLHALMADIQIPDELSSASLSQINFWATADFLRSSLHYDPYCNVLCVVAGRKRVLCLPPATTPLIAARPAYHESANHASFDLWSLKSSDQDEGWRHDSHAAGLDAHRRSKLKQHLFEAELGPGDALFIPEGWWHSVESAAGTLAVNFWWDSTVARGFGGEEDGFYLRRLAQRLTEKQKERMMDEAVAMAAGTFKDARAAKEALIRGSLESEDGEAKLAATAETAVLSLLSFGAEAFMHALTELAEQHPHRTAVLLTSDERAGLTPMAWEALTSGLERLVNADEERLAEFYDAVFACVEDRHELTTVMLAAKEAMGRKAMLEVLAAELGV